MNNVIICKIEFILYLKITSPKFKIEQNAETVKIGVTLMKSITNNLKLLISFPKKKVDILGKKLITIFNKINLVIANNRIIIV